MSTHGNDDRVRCLENGITKEITSTQADIETDHAHVHVRELVNIIRIGVITMIDMVQTLDIVTSRVVIHRKTKAGGGSKRVVVANVV